MKSDSNIPCWLEKRITACWIFAWAFVLSIYAPDQTIAAVYADLEEIIKEDYDKART